MDRGGAEVRVSVSGTGGKACGQENAQAATIQLESAEEAPSRTVWSAERVWLIAAVAGGLAIVAGFASWIHWSGNRKQRASTAMQVIPGTTYLGRETQPTLSPDGSHLAFAWEGENHDNFDIYVKVLGENRTLRLTADPRPEFSPVWSPMAVVSHFAVIDHLGEKSSLFPRWAVRNALWLISWSKQMMAVPDSQNGGPGRTTSWHGFPMDDFLR